jgi:hypothetical protein
MSKFSVALGNEFSVEHVEVVRTFEESRTRNNIAYGILAGGAVSLLLSTGIGFTRDDFGLVGDVWSAAGPLIGAVVGYYMNPGGQK